VCQRRRGPTGPRSCWRHPVGVRARTETVSPRIRQHRRTESRHHRLGHESLGDQIAVNILFCRASDVVARDQLRSPVWRGAERRDRGSTPSARSAHGGFLLSVITTVGDRGRHPTDLKTRAHDAVATDRRISVPVLFTTCDAACSSGVAPTSVMAKTYVRGMVSYGRRSGGSSAVCMPPVG
jgi:hypothetical protein